MPVYSTENIGFYEMRAIADILAAHPEVHSGALRAVLAFGPFVETEGTADIELLEVVENWQGPRRASFTSTSQLPLRGRLTLYFLTPEEFENPHDTPLPDIKISPNMLLQRVAKAYAVLLEEPDGYAFQAMDRFHSDGNTNMSPQAFFASLATSAAP
ncbi:MAG: hypothetical protein OHK0029_01580 [Armatimonadaceae bacterium]